MAKAALPAWLANSVQLPAASKPSVLPLTLQVAGVRDANATTKPDVLVATNGAGAVPSVWLPGDAKLMVCASSAAAATVNEFEAGRAGAYTALPAWLALTVQVPAASSVNTVPLTLHTLWVVDSNNTGKPEVAVASSGAGALPSVWLPGDAKLMDCRATVTVNEADTAAAAAVVGSPAWLASMVQVPTASKVSVLPLMVHTLGVAEVNATVKLALELAASAGAVLPSA